jgi:hypothetical protein
MSTLRLAHLAPELGPVDFCYQAARTPSFVGPVLRDPTSAKADAATGLVEGGALDASDLLDASTEPGPSAGDVALGYQSVSKYFTLEVAGTLTIAIIASGASSCATPIATGKVTLDPGKLSTVTVMPGPMADGGIDFSVVAFTDDRTTLSDKARVRVIHAALGDRKVPDAGALAVRVIAGQTTVLADRVEPRSASSPSQAVPVDGLGYTTQSPVAPPAAIGIGLASTGGGLDAGVMSWRSATRDLELRGGSLHTAFVVNGSPSGFQVIWCTDTSTERERTTCALVR